MLKVSPPTLQEAQPVIPPTRRMARQVTAPPRRGTPRQGALEVNPDLEALVCLRCESRYPIGDLFEGCPRCAGEGHAASVVAAYRPADRRPRGARLPVLGAPTLGEGNTPLIPLPWLAEALGLDSVALKAEYLNPTGSHKDRLSRLAAAWAATQGWRRVIAASSGNAGVSLAAYAARMELACTILIKEGTGGAWVREMARYGAEIEVVANSHARWARQQERVARGDVFPVTNHVLPPVGSHPVGIQGYKEVGYELFLQTGGEVDLVLVPTARGDLLWGIWAGFREAAADAGTQSLPRMVAVEPFPRLSRVLEGADYRGAFPGTTRQGSIGGDTVTWQSLHTLRAAGGWAVEACDADALAAQDALRGRGIPLELCAAAAVAALRALAEDGRATPKTRAVLLGTSDGRHDPEV